MFQLVLGDVGLGGWVEAADDGGGDNVACFGPWEKVVQRSTVGSADLKESAEGSDNFRITPMVRSSVMHSFKGFGGVADTFLKMAEVVWLEMRDAQGLVGHEKGHWGRKLPCNQNLEFNFFSMDPDLVSRSAGLRDSGDQYQLTGRRFPRFWFHKI